jgi:hypothetical protein
MHLQSVVMLSVCYTECHKWAYYAECHYAKRHYAERHYAECHYAECRHRECRGAIIIKLRQKA